MPPGRIRSTREAHDGGRSRDIETVLLRGRVLVEGGEVVAKPGIGQFCRANFGEQLAATVAEAPAAA
jgi:hypothetical protein